MSAIGTENAYLHAWFSTQKLETSAISLREWRSRFCLINPDLISAAISNDRQAADLEFQRIVGSVARSPRRSHIRDVGNRTIAHGRFVYLIITPLSCICSELQRTNEMDYISEPLHTLLKALSSYGDMDPDEFRPIETYFRRLAFPAGHILWRQGDSSDGLYVIEAGVLRATYEFANPSSRIEETMVAGTVAGELSGLSGSPRNATVTVEHAAVVWKMSADNLEAFQSEEIELSRTFLQLVLKG